MRRFSMIGLLANAAALVLLGLTGAAVADPSSSLTLDGIIGGSGAALLDFGQAIVDTLSPISVSSGSTLLYPIFVIVSLISSPGSSSYGSELIGYILSSDFNVLSAMSSYVSGDTAPIYTFSSSATLNLSGLFFQPTGQVSVPEPNSIAVVVTAVAGLATLLRRRGLRRGQK